MVVHQVRDPPAPPPGNCLQSEWWMPDQYGVDKQVAYGFTVPEHHEAAMQGIHAAKPQVAHS